MGNLLFVNRNGRERREWHEEASQGRRENFEPFDAADFSAMCWAMKASAEQLDAIALKAAIHGGNARRPHSQEAYLLMMLGPLAALDKLRRQLTRS